MATPNQIEANRRNAQRSTGPRTPEGKAVSRFNAVKTGITAKSMVIPGEDPAELETLSAEYHDQFQPATALERFLVDDLVSADWQLRRLRRIEAQLWTHELAAEQDAGDDAPLGRIFSRGFQPFQLLQRRIDAAERSYYRALKELQRIHREADSVPAPGPWLPAPAEAELASFSPIPFTTQISPPPFDSPHSPGAPLPPDA